MPVRNLALYAGHLFNGVQSGFPDRLADAFGFPTLDPVPRAEDIIPLEKSKFAFVTTAGFFVKGQEPFRETNFSGDFGFRIIPRDIPLSRLTFGKFSIDRRLAVMDPNLVFPIDRLKELKAENLIGEVALNHYSFCGHSSDRSRLLDGSATEVARRLRYDGVDKVLVIPASVLSQESAVLIQRVIEAQGIPSVSLIYSREAKEALKPPRSVVLEKASLYKLEEYLEPAKQRALLLNLLTQFRPSSG